MTKDDKLKERFQKWRAKLDKIEAKISEQIFKNASQRNKLWKACPHKWESAVEKDDHLSSRVDKTWFICGVCGGMRLATVEEKCIQKISETSYKPRSVL